MSRQQILFMLSANGGISAVNPSGQPEVQPTFPGGNGDKLFISLIS
jgi:hypothetical protein